MRYADAISINLLWQKHFFKQQKEHTYHDSRLSAIEHSINNSKKQASKQWVARIFSIIMPIIFCSFNSCFFCLLRFEVRSFSYPLLHVAHSLLLDCIIFFCFFFLLLFLFFEQWWRQRTIFGMSEHEQRIRNFLSS